MAIDIVLKENYVSGSVTINLAPHIPAKIYNGSSWVEVPVKRWTGTEWVNTQLITPPYT